MCASNWGQTWTYLKISRLDEKSVSAKTLGVILHVYHSLPLEDTCEYCKSCNLNMIAMAVWVPTKVEDAHKLLKIMLESLV